jgi:hypothetical protein
VYESPSVQNQLQLAGKFAHMGRITSILFSRPDRFLTCSKGSSRIGSGSNSLALWDLGGKERRRLLVDPFRWRCTALGPGGDRLALGRDGVIEIRSGWLIR